MRILTATDLKKGELGLIHGGPPCQAFSVFGRRKGVEDERGKLLWEFVRIVNELEPKSFVLENVSGLKTYEKSAVLNDLCERLSLDGKYKVSVHDYELANFGIPQFRRRIFLIGSIAGKTVPLMTPTHGDFSNNSLYGLLKPHTTAGEVLKGLGETEDTNLPNT